MPPRSYAAVVMPLARMTTSPIAESPSPLIDSVTRSIAMSMSRPGILAQSDSSHSGSVPLAFRQSGESGHGSQFALTRTLYMPAVRYETATIATEMEPLITAK